MGVRPYQSTCLPLGKGKINEIEIEEGGRNGEILSSSKFNYLIILISLSFTTQGLLKNL